MTQELTRQLEGMRQTMNDLRLASSEKDIQIYSLSANLKSAKVQAKEELPPSSSLQIATLKKENDVLKREMATQRVRHEEQMEQIKTKL